MCFVLITLGTNKFRFTEERQLPSSQAGEFSVIKPKTLTVDKLTLAIYSKNNQAERRSFFYNKRGKGRLT
jgi:hypothetical protein